LGEFRQTGRTDLTAAATVSTDNVAFVTLKSAIKAARRVINAAPKRSRSGSDRASDLLDESRPKFFVLLEQLASLSAFFGAAKSTESRARRSC